MELDKGLCVAMMLGVVSEMSLEGKSLEWLKKTRDEQSRIVADCERSAREIREYVITEYNGRDGASELVKERKAELVEAIERQAEMVQVLVKRIDDEIGNRQYKTEKEDKGMELKDIEAEVRAVKPEEMSVKALLEAGKRAQDSYTQLTRSAYEIGEYNLRGSVTDFVEVCGEAFELKHKLAGLLLDQANYYLSLMQTIDEELARRLETLDK